MNDQTNPLDTFLIIAFALVTVWVINSDHADLAAWVEQAALDTLESSADAQGLGP